MTQLSFTKTLLVGVHGMAIHGAMSNVKRAPGVIVIQHAPGIDTFIHHMVSRLANDGYVAVAPDLYHRQPHDQVGPLERMGRLKDREIIDDVNATVAYLREQPHVDAQRIAVMGFCMGGRIAYLMAAANPTFKASVIYYGGNIMAPWGDDVPAPFDRTRDIHCPILFHFGAEDENPSPADRAKLDAELTRCGKAHEFHTYANAGHAFMNFTNPERYRAPAAEASWPRTLDFLQRHLQR